MKHITSWAGLNSYFSLQKIFLRSVLRKRESFHVKYCKNDGNKFPVKSQDPEITWYHLQTGPWLPGAGCLWDRGKLGLSQAAWAHWITWTSQERKIKWWSHSGKTVGKQDWIWFFRFHFPWEPCNQKVQLAKHQSQARWSCVCAPAH